MKKILNFALVACMVLMAVIGCQKDMVDASIPDLKEVSFYSNEIETKTAFGEKDGTNHYPTFWTENDESILISLNYATGVTAEVTPSDDYRSATFNASFADDESGNYTFFALSPSTAKFSDFNAGYKSVGVTVPNTQTPLAGSVDEAAQILVAKSGTVTTFPDRVALDFTHALAYGKMSLLNLDLDDAIVSSITLTASENFAGRYHYYYDANGNYVAGDMAQNSATPTITLKTSSITDVWFACAPVDLSNGGTLKVTVNTNKGTYTKTITFPTEAGNFLAGKVASFKVDMNGITLTPPKEYVLVKSKDELTVGSEVVIASVGYDLAISTTQNTNNRGQASVTKSGEIITDPGDDVQIIQLVAGNGENTAALKVGEKYLYASGTVNHLRSGLLADNASWRITVSDAGVATIQNYEYPTYKIQHNNDYSMFSSYTTVQTDVAIYKLTGSGTTTPLFLPELDVPVIKVTADNETKKITVTWTDVENATSYMVECGDESETVTSGVQTYTFTVAEYATYDVTVTASAEGYASAKSSASVELTDPNAVEKYYVKVETEPADWSGTYLIVYEETPSYLDGSLKPGTNNGQMGKTEAVINTVISDKKIKSTSTVDKSTFTIAKSGGGYAIKTSFGTYMGQSGDSNGMKSDESASAYVHSIKLEDDSTVSILSSDGLTKLVYNKSSVMFRYYKVSTIDKYPTSYPLPTLYKLDE